MKSLIIIGMLFIGVNSLAADKFYLIGDKAQSIGKDAQSKPDALRALIKDSHAFVVQCQQVEITDKATLRNK